MFLTNESMAGIKSIGILTSGGDAPGMNAAIRAICGANPCSSAVAQPAHNTPMPAAMPTEDVSRLSRFIRPKYALVSGIRPALTHTDSARLFISHSPAKFTKRTPPLDNARSSFCSGSCSGLILI